MSPRRVYTRLGRRGQFLVYAGVAWFLLGYSYLVAPPRRPPGTLVVHDLVPYPWWGAIWMAAGVCGVAFAWTQWPGRDRWGYTALVVMPAAQSASYAMSWVLDLLHDWAWLQHLVNGWGWSIQAGDQRGWANAVIFLAIAAFVRLVAGWAEPTKRLPNVEHLHHPGRS